MQYKFCINSVMCNQFSDFAAAATLYLAQYTYINTHTYVCGVCGCVIFAFALFMNVFDLEYISTIIFA